MFCLCKLVSFAVVVLVCDNLCFSSVQTCGRAQAIRDPVGFAVLVLACDNVWFSSGQMCLRAQIVRDLAISQLLCSRFIICGLRACKRVGAHI